MGNCIFCGKKAGLLRKEHPECKQRYEEGERTVSVLTLKAASGSDSLAAAKPEIERIAKASLLPSSRVRQLLIVAWEKNAETAFENGPLTHEEENRLGAFAASFGLEDELNSRLWWGRMAVAGALRDLAEGKFPQRCHITGTIKFNLQPNERLAWIFPARAYEERKRTQFVGRSDGVSIRLAKGLYYRTSAFKGNPITTNYMQELGVGMLGLTDKHVYFHGSQAAFRIPYKKIVAFEPYSDGMGIHQEAASAKQKVFVTGDGWPVYNLAVNLAQQAPP